MPPAQKAALLAAFVFLASFQIASADVVRFPEAGGMQVEVEVADTPLLRQKGLMFRSNLKEDAGMWFVFPSEEAKRFWMKNVRFSIDIIFIGGDMRIKKIWKSVPPCFTEPCPTFPSGVPVRYALEVVSGFSEKYGINVNQKVEYGKDGASN